MRGSDALKKENNLNHKNDTYNNTLGKYNFLSNHNFLQPTQPLQQTFRSRIKDRLSASLGPTLVRRKQTRL